MLPSQFFQEIANLQLSNSSSSQDWLGSVVLWGWLIVFFGLPALIGWVVERISRRNAEIDKKLMQIIQDELPTYDYKQLKAEIPYIYAKFFKCPRCGGILEPRNDLGKLCKCTRAGCNYPGG